MNLLRNVCLLALSSALLLMGLTACRRETGGVTAPSAASGRSNNIVARIGDTVITLEQFEAELQRRSRGLAGRYGSEAGRRELLEQLIREHVLLARARAAGMDRDPELQRRFDRMVIAKYEEERKPDH